MSVFAVLLLTAALAGQAAVPTTFGWDYDETHQGATFDVEWATFASSGTVPCGSLVLTPTVDSRCTANLMREIETSVRLRVSKDGVSSYSSWLLAPPHGQGGTPPGVLIVTFVGEAPAFVSTTTSRRFDPASLTHIRSNVSGAAAGNNVGNQSNWTYAVWLRIAAAGDAGSICGIWSDNNYQALLMLSADGSVSGLMHGGFFFVATSPPNTIAPDRWYLLVLRHAGNGFAGVLSLWVNDVKVAESATSGTAPVGVLPFKIGAHGDVGTPLAPFNGWLSSIGVWRATAVSDADLQSLRNRYPGNPPAGITFLTIKQQDEVVDYIGGLELVNVGTAYSPLGPSGLQP
jgi:hypothetical protein